MARKIAFCGVFSALAVIIGWLERLIPMPVPAPGVKLGLANAVTLVVMYCVGDREALTVSAVRIFLGGFLFGGPAGLIYSLAGGLLGFAAMYGARRAGVFSVIGVSVAGGVMHNFGQIAVAAAAVGNYRLLYYTPALVVSGVAAGLAPGFAALYSIKYIKV